MPEAGLEVIVLGRSVGESIVVRLDDHGWLVVDSFMARRRPAPLRYLEYVHADPEQIRFVVATHWDNDHVRGLADVLAAAPGATFMSPGVADHEQLAELIAMSEVAMEADGHEHGADAYGQVLRVLARRREPV